MLGSRFWFAVLVFTLGFEIAAPSAAEAQAPPKSDGGFAETRKGDIPDGAAELITPETDRAITAGLAWLAKQQNPDGSFGNGAYRSNIAVTALAGLAFMSSGSSPGRGPYGVSIDKAIQFVMDNTAPSGFIAIPQAATSGPMYSHGFGTLFLAEAYGMTHQADVREKIREKLEKAVRLIIDTQNIEGGWRYQPIRRDADISVTVCQINALRAARNAGIFVPKETVDSCIRYVQQSQNVDGGFRYMITRGNSDFPRSAAGVVALYSAAVYDAKEVEAGISYLMGFIPDVRGAKRFNHYFYGQYYAAQAMWIRGGQEWNLWYPAIRDELGSRRTPQGFWSDSICNEYGTAMALIVLQMPNNYLPIFQR